MIAIYLVVIGSFICTLLKVGIDQWLADSSMKRLSLKRGLRGHTEINATNDVSVEVSDDDSFDSLPNLQRNTEHKKYTNLANHRTDIPNSMGETSSSTMDYTVCNSKPTHDSSSDEDIIEINEVPFTSNRKNAMFNWNKTASVSKSMYQHNIPSKKVSIDSRPKKKIFAEHRNKRMKTYDLENWIDEDLGTLNEPKKDISPPQVMIQHDIMIAGTRVKFPVKPYPCQTAVMNSLIQGCIKEQNCLLESPTGSGKTLALLCGVLAWQDQYSEKIHCEAGDGKDTEDSCCAKDDTFDDNFFLNSSQYFDEEWSDKTSRKNKSQKVPKIYYGTRTHKQIEQVVREFRKTAYRHKRMTILSSRDHTCIQDTERDKTELCNELLDAKKRKRCPYYTEQNRKTMASFGALNGLGLETPWDIEDLVSLGREINVCPYFAARSLMVEADIIFCPYNYIVDPNIRESMQINLKGNIVIIDEAHNIEDVCRDVAGVSLKDDTLADAAKECEKLSYQCSINRDNYSIIRQYLLDVVTFLKNIIMKENGNWQEMVSDCWPGAEFLVLLDMNNVGRTRFPTFLAASKAAIKAFDDMKEEARPDKMVPSISRETKKVLEYLCFAMQMITSETIVNDYRAYIIETIEHKKFTPGENVWISTKNSSEQRVRTMKLICMNPAVVFAPLALTVRSVILASGTLAPTSSFQSELGTQFSYMLNANHIISKEQVYVRCIPRGPGGKSLVATYDKVNCWLFQEELGNLIIQVCDAVPYGVLCFFSSYNVMNKMHERWKSNGMWNRISNLKQIFVEPKNNRELPIVMQEYRDVIQKSSSISFRQASGAILFAVFRGKIAEGIDFSDNEARCVLAIGIPYMNKKSANISMKMEYNDSNTSKGLLSGSEWYNVNAFRALNQGLGRCIRHKNDWGAVLLVDERFQKLNNISYLPKWIKTMWMNNANYDLQIELENFVALQVAREKGERLANAN